MAKNLGLLPLVIVLQVGFPPPASSQSSQPIGPATSTIGTVSNFNSTFSSNGTTTSSTSNSRPTNVILLPTGARRSTSISTITVCDFTDLSGSFPDVVDVCSLK